jgi:hypothetical protein
LDLFRWFKTSSSKTSNFGQFSGSSEILNSNLLYNAYHSCKNLLLIFFLFFCEQIIYIKKNPMSISTWVLVSPFLLYKCNSANKSHNLYLSHSKELNSHRRDGKKSFFPQIFYTDKSHANLELFITYFNVIFHVGFISIGYR